MLHAIQVFQNSLHTFLHLKCGELVNDTDFVVVPDKLQRLRNFTLTIFVNDQDEIDNLIKFVTMYYQ